MIDWAGTIAGVALPLHDDESIDWDSLEAHLETFAGCGLDRRCRQCRHRGGRAAHAAMSASRCCGSPFERIGDRVPVDGRAAARLTPRRSRTRPARPASWARPRSRCSPRRSFLGAPLAAEPVVAYYEAIVAATDVPLIAYQAPAGLGVTFEPDVLLRLAGVPGVAGDQGVVVEP